MAGKALIHQKIMGLLSFFVAPTLQDEDEARKQHILNILLFGALLLSTVALSAFFVRQHVQYRAHLQNLSSLLFLLTPALFFLALYILSRIGRTKLVAAGLLLTYFFAASYTTFRWGVSVPQALLILALIIIMSGVIIGRWALVISTFSSMAMMMTFNYLHYTARLPVDLSWKQSISDPGDTATYAITLAIMASVSWLYTREIEASLRRARNSEKALKKERDLLEMKVAERTHELKLTQQEQLAQVYRFAEIGKITSGLFHDLANPLTTASLNLEQLDTQPNNPQAKNVQRAVNAIKQIERFIQATRKQIQKQEVSHYFSLTEEINSACAVVHHRAKKEGLKISLQLQENLFTYGNAIKFNQIIANLLANAIDAFKGVKRSSEKRVITLILEETFPKSRVVRITIHDWGTGIKSEVQPHIFEPLFTTKDTMEGTGLGLALTKEVIERDFHGEISFRSSRHQGTSFMLNFPLMDQP